MKTKTKIKRIAKRLVRIAESDDAHAQALLPCLEELLSANDNGDVPEWVSQLRSLDSKAYVKRFGVEALRVLLTDFSSDELKDYAKNSGIVAGGVSKLSKADIVNRIIVASRAA